MVGGDLSAGEELAVSVTVLGDLDGLDPVLRSGARVGDVVAHAGVRGRSAAGLAALAAGRGQELPDVVQGYLRPRCPLAAGPAAARAGATSMLDVSDGLVRGAGRLARASGVRFDLGDILIPFVLNIIDVPTLIWEVGAAELVEDDDARYGPALLLGSEQQASGLLAVGVGKHVGVPWFGVRRMSRRWCTDAGSA